MRAADAIGFGWTALARAPGRTVLMLIAMAIGVAAVVVLTGLGEGARRYVTGEFASLGTNLLIVVPGRTETTGGAPTLLAGETARDLTLDDALALERSAAVRRVAPVAVGQANVSYGGRERESPVLGSTADLLEVRRWRMAYGQFLPLQDPTRPRSVAVIGRKLESELFAGEPALGRWLRVGDRRFRVIGVLASEGRSIGVDVQEVVILPVASAQALFNTASLFRILVEAAGRDSIQRARTHVLETIASRHQGEEDVTVITQDAVLATFDQIFRTLTLAVSGIAAISLGVAGVLIMNVMLVAVSQRTREIGLLKALGASGRQILSLFLIEAAMLAALGALAGLAVGALGLAAGSRLYPGLELVAPRWAVVAALGVAVSTGLLFGLLPARTAARLDPVAALQSRVA